MPDFREVPLNNLPNLAGMPGSQRNIEVEYEFMRRQTQAQIEAAQATKDTAEYTKQNARYMLWSVIVLVLSSLATLFVNVLSYLATRPH